MKKKLKIFFVILGLIIAGIIMYMLVRTFLPDFNLSVKTDEKIGERLILDHIRSHGFGTALLLVLLMSIFTSIPGCPIAFIGIFSGVCYGPLIASIMNITGITLGNIANYIVIKKFKLIKKESSKWVQVISKNKHPYISITTGYMIPIFPSVMVNYAASLLNIPFKKIIIMNIIGALPSSLLYAFGGDALFKGNKTLFIVLILSVGFLFVLILLLKREKREKKQEKNRKANKG